MEAKNVAKVVIQTTLLVIVFYYFGIDCWNKYMAEKTVVTVVEEDLGEIAAPSVTVCSLDAKTYMGWADPGFTFEKFPTSEIVGEMCPNLEGDDLVDCVEKNTFNLTTIVKNAGKGLLGKNQLNDTKYWRPEFSYSSQGMCQTLETNLTLGTAMTTESLKIELNANFANYITVHDPKLYLASWNPSVPFQSMRVDGSTVYRFNVVRHRNLDVRSKRCNPDPSYSFTSCIKKRFSSEVGCRLHWDRWTDPALPECHSLEQYRSTTN